MIPRLQHANQEFIGPGKNQYQVLERISAGGMGTVYKVENVLTGKLYAVKECDLLDDPRKKQISRNEAIKIFLREGKLLEELRFPGIPSGFMLVDEVMDLRLCLSCGNRVLANQASCTLCCHQPESLYYQPSVIDRRYYLFMEYIQGSDAVCPMASMPKPLSSANLGVLTSWIREVAVILSFLHSNNLVHRDVKPENIRIRNIDGKVFLLDYGLMEHAESVRKTLDLSDAANLGTEGYAPPEQAGNPPEPANDVFSLAMTFLAMATGLDPTNPLQKNQLQQTDPCLLIPGLSPRVAQLVTRSLQHRPSLRPTIPDWISTLETATDPAAWQALPSSSRYGDSPPRSAPQGLFSPLVRRVFLAAMAVLVLVLAWPLIFDGDDVGAYEVTARSGAVLFARPLEDSAGSMLDHGQILKVKSAGEHAQDNWLRVLSVDGKSRRGYVKRNKVDSHR